MYKCNSITTTTRGTYTLKMVSFYEVHVALFMYKMIAMFLFGLLMLVVVFFSGRFALLFWRDPNYIKIYVSTATVILFFFCFAINERMFVCFTCTIPCIIFFSFKKTAARRAKSPKVHF